ncbi:MAG TPA: PIN domain-containing protein [Acidimicrobiales bacterium]|nr:PIN domain-containing protein [Acidimicrobiales bacterium]
MAVAGWLLDKRAAARAAEPATRRHLEELAGLLYLCPVGELEQLHSARSAGEYDALSAGLHESFEVVAPPAGVFDRAGSLQRDLARHHGMWHRTPIADLFIAETALHHGLGVVHVDRGYERRAEVRPLSIRRLQ